VQNNLQVQLFQFDKRDLPNVRSNIIEVDIEYNRNDTQTAIDLLTYRIYFYNNYFSGFHMIL